MTADQDFWVRRMAFSLVYSGGQNKGYTKSSKKVKVSSILLHKTLGVSFMVDITVGLDANRKNGGRRCGTSSLLDSKPKVQHLNWAAFCREAGALDTKQIQA